MASDTLVLASDAELPVPGGADQVAATREYLVGPADKLRIDAYPLEDLSREVLVDSAGWISFPLVGQLRVSGKSPSEITLLIEERLRSAYVRDPQVSVNVVEAASQVVIVDGEVTEPGLYPISNHTSLMRVIAGAKGLSEFSNPKNVVVLRTIGQKQYAGVYNLNSIRAGRYEDPKIYSNDVVLVGESAGKRVLQNLIQISPAVLAPMIYLLR